MAWPQLTPQPLNAPKMLSALLRMGTPQHVFLLATAPWCSLATVVWVGPGAAVCLALH